jgi:tetratricopeptide (TPR) repeat protein
MRIAKNILICLCVVALTITGGTGCSKVKKARRMAAAEKHFKAGDYEKAELEYRAALQIPPADPAALSRLGAIFYAQGRYAWAKDCLTRALQLNPGNLDAKVLLGRTLTEFGAVADGYELARQVLTNQPGNLDAIVLFADTAQIPQVQATRKLLEAAPQSAKASAAWSTAMAMLLAKEKKLAEAEQTLNSALSKDPKNHLALHTLGNLYFVQNDLVRAEATLKRAYEAAPPRSITRMAYIKLIRRVKGLDEAKAIAQALAKETPDFVPPLVFLAEAAQEQNNMQECSALVEKILTMDPHCFPAQLLKGSVLIAAGDTNAVGYLERMIEPWRKAVEQNPQTTTTSQGVTNQARTNVAGAAVAKQSQAPGGLRATSPNQSPTAKAPPLLLQKLGEAYLLVGDQDKALDYLKEAINKDPNLFPAVIRRDAILISRGGADAERAVGSLERLTKQVPNVVEVKLLLAAGYRRLGKYDLAIQQYSDLAEKFPKNPDYPFNAGLVYLSRTNFTAARQALEKALAVEPGHLPALDTLLQLDIFQGRKEAALQRLEQEIGKRPDSAPLRYFEARTHAQIALPQANREGTTAGAAPQTSLVLDGLNPETKKKVETALLKAVEIDPLFKPAVLTLSSLYAVSGQVDQGIAQLVAFTSRTNDLDVLMQLAVMQDQNKDREGATHTYEKMLALAPGNIVALNNLALITLDTPGQLDKALELAKRARDILPRAPAIADTLGWVYFRRGEYDRALPLIQESVEQLPDNQEIQFHLGITQYMLGNEQEAKANLEKALSIQVDFPRKQEAQGALAVLNMKEGSSTADAVVDLEKRLAENPNDLPALRRLAAAHELGGAFEKAANEYQQYARAVRATAAKAQAMIRAASILDQKLNKSAQALELAKAARPLDPQNPQLAKMLGRLLYDAGDAKYAASLLEEAVRARNDREAIYQLGLAYYALGRIGDAEGRMRELASAAGDKPFSPQAKQLLSLSGAASDPSKAPQAVAEAQKLLETQPGYLPALHLLAAAQEQSGKFKEAAQAYERILEKYPTFTPATKQLIVLCFTRLGDDAQAYTLAAKNRDLVAQDSDLANILGILSFRREDYQAAARYLQQAQAQVKSPEGIACLQLAKAKLRQKPDLKALQSAIDAGLPAAIVQEAKKVLAENQRAGK